MNLFGVVLIIVVALILRYMGSLLNKSIQENNIGGVKFAIFLPMRYITSIPLMGDGFIPVWQVVINNTTEWWRMQFTLDTAKASYTEKEGPEGPYYDIVLKGQLPKDFDSRFPQWKDFRNEQFCIVYVDNNRKARMIGYIDRHGNKHGARLLKNSTTGQQGADLNYIDLTFAMKSIDPPTPSFYTELEIDDGWPATDTNGGIGIIITNQTG